MSSVSLSIISYAPIPGVRIFYWANHTGSLGVLSTGTVTENWANSNTPTYTESHSGTVTAFGSGGSGQVLWTS
jgi:hypothetical protein